MHAPSCARLSPRSAGLVPCCRRPASPPRSSRCLAADTGRARSRGHGARRRRHPEPSSSRPRPLLPVRPGARARAALAGLRRPGYTATLDYARAAVHAKYRRVQVQEPGRGGRTPTRPRISTRPAATAGTSAPAPTSIPANLAGPNATPSCGRRRRASTARDGAARRGREAAALAAARARDLHDRSIRSATKGSSAPRRDAACARSWIRRSPATRRSSGASGRYRDFGGVRFPDAHR